VVRISAGKAVGYPISGTPDKTVAYTGESVDVTF
jgi:hypothetical protein